MKLHIKPEQVYIAVFCFFAVGAGCKAVGEYAYDMLGAGAADEAPLVEPAGTDAERMHFQVVEHPDAVHLEVLTATPVKPVDKTRVER